MKIISSFNDYYDIGLAYETNDNQIVYLREPMDFKIFNDEKYPPLVKDVKNIFYKALKINRWEWRFKDSLNYDRFEIDTNKYRIYHSTHRIVFCGKIYSMAELQLNKKRESYSNTFRFYDFESYQKFLNEYEIEFYDNKVKQTAENFFNVQIKPDEVTFLIENKITNFVISDDHIIFNAKLADYDFYKVFDPYSAYQELTSWLGGVLAYPQNIMIEVEDKIKVTKHGFDKKYGFRTRPKK